MKVLLVAEATESHVVMTASSQPTVDDCIARLAKHPEYETLERATLFMLRHDIRLALRPFHGKHKRLMFVVVPKEMTKVEQNRLLLKTRLFQNEADVFSCHLSHVKLGRACSESMLRDIFKDLQAALEATHVHLSNYRSFNIKPVTRELFAATFVIEVDTLPRY